jgi:reversibly glycosylated polypeptide
VELAAAGDRDRQLTRFISAHPGFRLERGALFLEKTPRLETADFASEGGTMKTTIVVPTIRENCIRDFLDAWKKEFVHAHVIVVEDNPTRTFDLGGLPNVSHYSWEDIDRELGDVAWIIPRRTDTVRSYGYYKAYFDRPDMIVTLDDDCYPTGARGEAFLQTHWQRLEEGGTTEAWQATGTGMITRGYPYHNFRRRWRCVLNHGMWNRVPDYDAPTQLVQARLGHPFGFENQTIPVGRYFPMCGMNVAFRPEVVPAFYFMLMGRDYAFDRFGDIWAGVFVKKICDHLGASINSGDPPVDHQRASNVWANLRKEAPGLEINETLWTAVDATRLAGTTFGECYRELAQALPCDGPAREYMTKLRDAMIAWTRLFEMQPELPPASPDDLATAIGVA